MEKHSKWKSTQHGMSLKIEYHSKWNVAKMECHSEWNVTQMECHSNLNVTQIGRLN